MKKILMILIAVAITVSSLISVAGAEGTGKAYTYNHRQEAVPIPDPYEVEQVIGGTGFGFNKPQDMVYNNHELYVLDSGNKKVVVLDRQFNPVRSIQFTRDGAEYSTMELRGLWVDAKGDIFIADRSKKIVFQTDPQGRVIREYGKPETDLMDENTDFLPCKVMTDHLGQIYILAENEYRGIITINREGKFMGFYGSKEVSVNSELLVDMLWRNLMTDEQRNRTRRYLPVEYSNMSIDKKGFVYTVSGTSENMTELIRKLNSQGLNVLQNKGVFGDYHLGVSRGTWFFTNFNAIAIDEQGYLTVVDRTWNRIFQYSSEGELLYIFGGKGEQSGTFSAPEDIESMGDKLLVLDADYGNITVFRPTSFGTAVRTAERLYQDGRFQESIAPWNEVLRQNSNYEFAYIGIGKSLVVEKKYKEALEYFKLGYSHGNYSLAFKRYRSEVLRSNFSLIMFAVILIFIVFPMIMRFLRKKGLVKKIVLDESGKLQYLLHLMVHPADGYDELRYNKKYSLGIANAILIAWFFITALNYNYQGFIFNYNDPNDFNVFIIFATTIGLMAVFCLVNWLLSTFFEGKGKLREVWIYSCYALLPLVTATALQTILSHYLTQDEGVFLNYLTTIGTAWTIILLVFAVQRLHQYTFKRNMASLFATVLGILVIVFLLFLMCNLYIQVKSFVDTVVKEFLYRIKTGF